MNSPLLLTLALVIFYAGVTLLFIEKKRDEKPALATVPVTAQVTR